MKRLAVYCGSATPADPVYLEEARRVGRTLAQRGIGIVYGGARLGLMGALADAALQAGGEVIGIIPEALVGAEIAHLGCTELQVVPGMHERKRVFTDRSDGFLTLPGGVGTMDELWEALSWAQLGYHHKPVGLLNIAGFYDSLVTFYRQLGDVGFIRPAHRELLLVRNDLDPLLEAMVRYRPPPSLVSMRVEDL